MKLVLLVMVACGILVPAVFADGTDDLYVKIYGVIQEGDRLSVSGQSPLAKTKYLEAATALKKLQSESPAWNPAVVKFRLRYLTEKLGDTPIPETGRSVQPGLPRTTPAVVAPVVDERDSQIAELKDAFRRLEGEKAILEAKLKEALTAQPAGVDPRELARMEERLRTTEKERELLRLALDRERAQKPTTKDTATIESLKSSLADANRKLIQQQETAAALAREKEILEGRVAQLERSAGSNVASLRAENESLKKQMAARPQAKESKDSDRRTEKLQAELKDARDATQASARTIAKLQQENRDSDKARGQLQKQLADATSELKSSDVKATELADRLKKSEANGRKKLMATTEPSARELAALRARLVVLEAQKVPYTPEELALFRQPEPRPLKQQVVKSPTAPERSVPAGAAPLLAEAERAFATRNYPAAEQKYQEALKLDDRSSTTLSNMAATQIEQRKWDEADATIKRALATDPNDSHAMTLMGILHFRQARYDDAFAALSQAAQADPQNAEAQNYLGITLSQKGQRVAAESALRKAVQISPGYGSAHHNLAVVYATQKPPFLALARWHYQKSLAAGHPQNQEVEKLLMQAETTDAK
ncbi:MAG: tetratricopeptide repeat protein [Pedosphaera sp.]|nr:tetratricopeptide repeat protein [Pedosphaera sp.]